MKHLLSPLDFSTEELDALFELADDIERNPEKYAHCRDSSVEKMSSAPFSDTFKLFFGIRHHLPSQRFIGFCHLAFGVMLVDALAYGTDLCSPDRSRNGLVEHFDLAAVSTPNQI